tara:strand:+ start:62 stop:211 length:150 start_codon:yes stop_codon:yes gene_type:complete
MAIVLSILLLQVVVEVAKLQVVVPVVLEAVVVDTKPAPFQFQFRLAHTQ